MQEIRDIVMEMEHTKDSCQYWYTQKDYGRLTVEGENPFIRPACCSRRNQMIKQRKTHTDKNECLFFVAWRWGEHCQRSPKSNLGC
jgi:hypothetical protein